MDRVSLITGLRPPWTCFPGRLDASYEALWQCYSPASQFYCVIASRFLPSAFQFAIDFDIFLIAHCRSRANEEQVTCRMKRGRLWVQSIARATHETGYPYVGVRLVTIRPPVTDSAGGVGMRHRVRLSGVFSSVGFLRNEGPKPALDRISCKKIAASCFLAPKTGPSSIYPQGPTQSSSRGTA